MRHLTLIAVFMFLPFPPVAGQQNVDNTDSANFLLPGCKAFVEMKLDIPNAQAIGLCAGIMTALGRLGPNLPPAIRFCSPAGATQGQLFRIVVQYVESKPERMHENFVDLALEALHSTWPCR